MKGLIGGCLPQDHHSLQVWKNNSMHFAHTAYSHYPTLDAFHGMLEAIGVPVDTADLAANFPSMLPCNAVSISIDTFSNFITPDFNILFSYCNEYR